MVIDLARDAQTVREFLNRRVEKHAAQTSPAAVGMVVVGFQFGDDGWVAVYFDTRAKPRPDGKWRNSIEQHMLRLPEWSEAFERLGDDDEPLEFIDPAGVRTTAATTFDDLDQDAVAARFGDMLKGVLLRARDEGLFRKLPKADGCGLRVEELEEDGYVWPDPDERGEDNLA